MEKNKDLSFVLLSDPCEERSVHAQTVLGRVDVHSITEEVNCSKERRIYTKWKDKDRFEIGDYARTNGNSAALRKYKLKFPGLKESTIRSFKTRVIKEIKRCFKRATRGYTITEKSLKTNRTSR